MTKRIRSIMILVIIAILIIGVPYLFLNYRAGKSSKAISEVIQRKMIMSGVIEAKSDCQLRDESTKEKIDYFIPETIGQKFTEAPMISHVIAVNWMMMV